MVKHPAHDDSELRNEANAEVTFYISTCTGDICAAKMEDVDRDDDCDGDDPIGVMFCNKRDIISVERRTWG
jgi:hypothetical protein